MSLSGTRGRPAVGLSRFVPLADPFSMGSGVRESLAPLFDGIDFVVVDSYRASSPWLAWVAERRPLIVIDDFRDRPVERYATALLNYNLDAERWPYELFPNRLRLLGPAYALLRPEVAFWADQIDSGTLLSGEDVLFVAGASDMAGATESILRWWDESWPPLSAVLGPLVDASLQRRCRAAADGKENVALLEAPNDFLERMARSGRVICTSSVTAYEALALGRPLAVFQVADNQRGIGEAIQAKGLGHDLGFWGSFGRGDLEAVLSLSLGGENTVVTEEGTDHPVARGDTTLARRPCRPRERAVVDPRGALAAAAALAAFFERGGRR